MAREYKLRDPRSIRNSRVPVDKQPGLPGFEKKRWVPAMLPQAVGKQEVHVWHSRVEPLTKQVFRRSYLVPEVLECRNGRAKLSGKWYPLSVEGFLLVIEL